MHSKSKNISCKSSSSSSSRKSTTDAVYFSVAPVRALHAWWGLEAWAEGRAVGRRRRACRAGAQGGGCGLAISVDGFIKGGALPSRFQFKEAATMLAPVRWGGRRRRRRRRRGGGRVLTCNIRPALFDYVAQFLNSKVLLSAHVSESKFKVLPAGCWARRVGARRSGGTISPPGR